LPPQPVKIAGNVGPATGNVDVPGDLHVGGSVADAFEVRAAGSVSVDGVVEAASVQAGGDLVVAGGIAGKQRACCVAGGHVRARYVRQAGVRAGGDVAADVEVAHSNVLCSGALTVTGPIVGGRVTAGGSVSCRSAGNASGVATVIELGADELFKHLAAEPLAAIRQHRAKIAHVRSTVAPLLRNSKALTAEQKERATELLFEADTLEEQCHAALTSLATRYSRARALPRPTLTAGVLHAGVVLRVDGMEATVPAAIQGPVEVTARQVADDPRFDVRDVATGDTHSLPSVCKVDPVVAQLREELAFCL
jgi:uncharacterized protein (DUF342 family)